MLSKGPQQELPLPSDTPKKTGTTPSSAIPIPFVPSFRARNEIAGSVPKHMSLKDRFAEILSESEDHSPCSPPKPKRKPRD